MTDTRTPTLTGGCQCGAVRYAFYGEAINPHICHCRMCQKAFGNYFGSYVGTHDEDFAWTRGSPATFLSSPQIERGFCATCGTPLSFRYLPRPQTSVSLGSLDDPKSVPPIGQYGMESRMPFFAHLNELPAKRTDEALPAQWLDAIKSNQHPDHET